MWLVFKLLHCLEAYIDFLCFVTGKTATGVIVHIVQGKTKKEGQFDFLRQVDKRGWKSSALREPCVLPHPTSGVSEERVTLYLIFPSQSSWGLSSGLSFSHFQYCGTASLRSNAWAWRGRIIAMCLQSFFPQTHLGQHRVTPFSFWWKTVNRRVQKGWEPWI